MNLTTSIATVRYNAIANAQDEPNYDYDILNVETINLTIVISY